jgi:hypothetical protein
MGLRSWINQNQAMAGGIAAVLVVVAIVFVVYQMTHSGAGEAPPPPTGTPDFTRAFYSDDDGKSYFVDKLQQVTPFPHAGKTAVRAYVFKCGSTTMVGYLGRANDAGRATAGASTLGSDERKVPALAFNPPIFEVKKPGDAQWVPLAKSNQAQWQTVIDVKCPSGDVPIGLFVGQQ